MRDAVVEAEVQRALRQLHAVGATLFLGLGLLGLLAVVLSGQGPVPGPASDLLVLRYTALLVSGLCLIASFMVRAALLTREGRPSDPAGRIHRYRQAVLLGLSLNEGAALFALVVVFLHGRAFPGLYPALLSALGMYFHLPSRWALDRFLALRS